MVTTTLWVPDSDVTACQNCTIAFTALKRKHHCRHCGKIFCGPCSDERMLLPPTCGVRDPQRVCMNCATELQPLQAQHAEALGNCHKTNHLSDSRGMFPEAVRAHVNNPFTMTLGSAIRNATYTLKEQMDPMLIPDKKIPQALLSQAEGFLFITFVRVGFVGGARCGTGLAIMKRLDGTWSAPSAVGMGGVSVGFLIGGDVVNLCLVLMNRQVCEVLSNRGQVTFDGEFGVSLGPVGRTGSAGVNISSNGVAPVYSYCQSRGLFAGVEVNGNVIVSRKRVNHRFYGVHYEPHELLMGEVPRPDAGHELYEALMQVTAPQALSAPPDNVSPPGAQDGEHEAHLGNKPASDPSTDRHESYE